MQLFFIKKGIHAIFNVFLLYVDVERTSFVSITADWKYHTFRLNIVWEYSTDEYRGICITNIFEKQFDIEFDRRFTRKQ